MGQIAALSNDIQKVAQYTMNAALKSGRTSISTAGLWDGVQRLFAIDSSAAGDHKYTKLAADIKGVLGKYGINSDRFNKATDMIIPGGDELPKNVRVTMDDDATDVFSVLQNQAQTQKRTMEFDDLISQLFANKAYKLFMVFSAMSESMKAEYDAAVESGVAEDQLPPTGFDVNIFYADMQKILVKTTVREIKSLESEDMAKYLTNINKYVASRKDLKFIGMDGYNKALEVDLAGRTKRSAVLVGPAGTGKTSVVYELAQRINAGEVNDGLKGSVIYELHMDAIVSGCQYRGQFEARLKNILDAVSKLKNVILFIDEFHTMISAGGGGSDSGGEMTGANLIKPYLSRGDIQVIGATTDEEYNKYVKKDKAITRRFKKILIQEPNKEETIEIMKTVLPVNEDYFDKSMAAELMDKVYDLSIRYDIDSMHNPDKALTLLESGFAYCKVCKAKEKAVTVQDVLNAIAIQYNINITTRRAADTKAKLSESLLGEEKPLAKIGKYLDMIDLGIVDKDRPSASLLLAGPTGTGKTETAKIIAKQFTGSENNLIIMNGNSLASETGVNAIYGSDKGYVGYEDTSDFLQKVMQHPNCVVLFDEIEKADPAVFKALLNILDEGYAQDKAGNKISFRNAIILFTTNLGYGTNAKETGGIMSVSRNETSAKSAIAEFFSPEFLNRLDDIVYYDRLDPKVVMTLIERYRKEYEDNSGITGIEFTKADINRIKKSADVSTNGARDLRHAVHMAFYDAYLKQKDEAVSESKGE